MNCVASNLGNNIRTIQVQKIPKVSTQHLVFSSTKIKYIWCQLQVLKVCTLNLGTIL